MRIMTFNIRGALYEDGLNHWRERASLNLRTLAQHVPDLLGLQEPHLENINAYRQNLAGYGFELGTPYNDHDPYQYTAIGWNAQHLRLLESGGFWLSETPEVHSRSWETRCIRSATWARFEWLPTGLIFLHLNTHLDHVSEPARVEGARLIVHRLSQMAQERLPMVVTGDFNCLPDSPAYQVFQTAGFVDTYRALDGSSPANTYHGFLGPAYDPTPENSDRIDWILLRGWQGIAQLQSCEILRDGEPPIFPSDHYPVIADLNLNLSCASSFGTETGANFPLSDAPDVG